jgi:hypothetical protein
MSFYFILWNKTKQTHEYPIPMISDNSYLQKLENAEPLEAEEVQKLENKMGFGY